MSRLPPRKRKHRLRLATAVARKQAFQSLGETRLAGSVAPDDERQTRPRREIDTDGRADPAKALHREGHEVGAHRLHSRSREDLPLRFAGGPGGEDDLKLLWPFQRRDDVDRSLFTDRRVGLQA